MLLKVRKDLLGALVYALILRLLAGLDEANLERLVVVECLPTCS